MSLDCAAFARLDILPQDRIDGGLIALALFAKKRQHIGIDAQGYLLLRPRPHYGMRKKIRSLLWNVGIVDVFISKRVNSLPVRPGALFRILSARHDRPFSTR